MTKCEHTGDITSAMLPTHLPSNNTTLPCSGSRKLGVRTKSHMATSKLPSPQPTCGPNSCITHAVLGSFYAPNGEKKEKKSKIDASPMLTQVRTNGQNGYIALATLVLPNARRVNKIIVRHFILVVYAAHIRAKCTPAVLGSPTLIEGQNSPIISRKPVHGQDGCISLPACSSQCLLRG